MTASKNSKFKKLSFQTTWKYALSAVIGAVIAGSIVYAVKPSADDEILVKGENIEISRGQLVDTLMRNYGENELELMTRELVIQVEAEKQGIEVTREEIDEKVELYRKYYGEEGFAEYLTQLSMNEEQFRHSGYLNLILAELMKKEVEVTEEEMKAYFEENKDNLGKAATVEASHILVKDKATADMVKAKLEEGSDFSKLAAEYSIDETTAKKDGYLGIIEPGQMIPEFEGAAFALAEGGISAPVESEYGFHIIKVTKKTDPEAATYENSKEAVKEGVFAQKSNAMYETWIQELVESYKVENKLK